MMGLMVVTSRGLVPISLVGLQLTEENVVDSKRAPSIGNHGRHIGSSSSKMRSSVRNVSEMRWQLP